MPLEDLVGPNKFLDSLVREWPLGIDPLAEGDDHLRGIKNAVLNSFPTVGEARYPASFLLPPAGESEEKNGALEISTGTDAQRPTTPSAGAVRYNTTTFQFEQYSQGAWRHMLVTDLPAVLEDALIFEQPNLTPAQVKAATWLATLIDATVGDEDARLAVKTLVAGAEVDQLYIENGLYTPGATGGAQGLDTVNAGALYENGVRLPQGHSADKKTASGTSLTWTGLEGRTNFMISATSLTGGNSFHVQLGHSGGLVTTGYQSAAMGSGGGSVALQNSFTSFTVRYPVSAAATLIMAFQLVDPATNLWHGFHHISVPTHIYYASGNGHVALGAGNDLSQLAFTSDGTMGGEVIVG